MKLLTLGWDIFKKFPLLFAVNLLLIMVGGIIEATSVLTLVPIMDYLVSPSGQGVSTFTQRLTEVLTSIGWAPTLTGFLVLFLAFNVVRSGVQVLSINLNQRIKYAVLQEMLLGTFTDIFQARWYFFSSNKQGTLLNTFTRELAVVGDAIGTVLPFINALLQLALYMAVPLYLSWQITSVSMLAALLLATPFILVGRFNYRLGQVNTTTANEMGKILQESLGAAKLILGYSNQPWSITSLRQAFNAHRRAAIKLQTLNQIVTPVYYPLGLVVLVIALFLAQRMAMPLSELSAIIYSFLRVLPFVGQLPGYKNTLDGFFPSYEQFLQLRERARQLQQSSGDLQFSGIRDQIALESLSFAHPDQEPTLCEITVRIPKGKLVAFVGESGAGKSTLADMLMGFYEPTAGQVTIDGVSLQEFDLNSYRRRIGYVPQESVLFNMSIRDNLRWADSTADDEAIQAACQRANAAQFIREFPDGYDTLVGDRGVRLSGGQIQRIALARALLRKPELLILDEATSALDTQSERLIQQSIEDIAHETTVVIIAHRLSTIINADLIVVLQNGRIIEEGDFHALMGQGQRFSQMVRLQELELDNQNVEDRAS
jgi:ABC-type multidrug transport system fused ATPase/permease subunit